jgi:hypothetical protein
MKMNSSENTVAVLRGTTLVPMQQQGGGQPVRVNRSSSLFSTPPPAPKHPHSVLKPQPRHAPASAVQYSDQHTQQQQRYVSPPRGAQQLDAAAATYQHHHYHSRDVPGSSMQSAAAALTPGPRLDAAAQDARYGRQQGGMPRRTPGPDHTAAVNQMQQQSQQAGAVLAWQMDRSAFTQLGTSSSADTSSTAEQYSLHSAGATATAAANGVSTAAAAADKQQQQQQQQAGTHLPNADWGAMLLVGGQQQQQQQQQQRLTAAGATTGGSDPLAIQRTPLHQTSARYHHQRAVGGSGGSVSSIGGGISPHTDQVSFS